MNMIINLILSLIPKKVKMKGRVVDFGLNQNTGEFLVMIKLTDGNPIHLKQFLEMPNKKIAFNATIEEYPHDSF
ncbi:hypothetical protein MASR1M48_16480 [Lactococcus petauri]